MSSTLVVGASGPLGRAVVAELTAAGHDVAGVSRSGGGSSERVDITDSPAAAALLDRVRPGSVVYLARPDGDLTGAAMDTAVSGLESFVAQCAEAGVERFVFASSAAVYGTASGTPAREDDPLVADSAYAELKIRSERAIGSASGLGAVSLRVFNVWGPGFHNSLVNRLLLDHDPVMYETHRYVRDYVHSTDVARAFRLAVELADGGTPVLNVGTGVGTSNPALVDLFPGARFRAHHDTGIESYSVADISRIRALWAFEPRVALADAVLYPDFIH